MTVTENTDRNIVLHTKDGVTLRIGRSAFGEVVIFDALSQSKDIASNLSPQDAHALADWIKAHVPEPKPAWHDAKDGEAWLIKLDPDNKSYPDSMAAIVQGDKFFFKSALGYPEPDYIEITAVESARRIWPSPEGETNA